MATIDSEQIQTCESAPIETIRMKQSSLIEDLFKYITHS